MYIDRACCGAQSNQAAICTAPSVDLSVLGNLKTNVDDLVDAVSDVINKENEAEIREERLERNLINVTVAQEREDLRTQVIINNLLSSAARQTAIKETTTKIDNTTDDIKAKAEILQNQTVDSLEVVEGEE